MYLFYFNNVSRLFLTSVLLFFICYFWWKDVVRERAYLRFHVLTVQNNLKIGIVWFIVSEVFFFFRFFWTFFHSSLNSVRELRELWPPLRVNVLNPLRVPLLNTVVLISSRLTVTWSHYSVLEGKFNEAYIGLVYTVFLRAFFTALQAMEYLDSRFSISDSVYRSIFFMATRFHGFHVLVRSIFLLVILFRIKNNFFSDKHHVRFECSIWYWHFVDVVWIFLYCVIYWWRSF